MLLASVLRAMGVDVRLALVREFQRDPGARHVPRPDLWQRPVLRVVHGGRTFWLDPAQRHAPFGALAPSTRGQEALLTAAPGAPEERVRLPDGPEADPRDVELAIALEPDGTATVDGVETFRGWDAAQSKASVERVDPTALHQAVEQSLARSFRNLRLEKVALEGAQDPEAPLVVRWRARVAGWAHLEGGRAVVDVAPYAARVGARFAQRASRETPLLVPHGEDQRIRLRITAPPGWKAAAGERAAESPHGTFRRTERTDGGALVREDRFTLKRARIAPAAYPGFATWANAVDAAQAAPLAFELPAQAALAR
jgi:hypothetical protein